MPTYELVFRCAACNEPIAVRVAVDAFDPAEIAELRCRHCNHDVVERTAPTFAVKHTRMPYRPELGSRPPRKPRSRRKKVETARTSSPTRS
jgi:phage FluMu protein Com